MCSVTLVKSGIEVKHVYAHMRTIALRVVCCQFEKSLEAKKSYMSGAMYRQLTCQKMAPRHIQFLCFCQIDSVQQA